MSDFHVEAIDVVEVASSWKTPETHLQTLLSSNWYKGIFEIMARVVDATSDFYRQKGIVPALMPITAGSISSPMGLGSDSLPVSVDLFGERTYLADSMQFQLELLVRMADKGVYYIMPTFRGEDPDKRHLNQFFHSEVEIKGNLQDIMALGSQYVCCLAQALLDGCSAFILSKTQTLAHIEALARKKGNIPAISFDEAQARLVHIPGALQEPVPGHFSLTSAGEKELIRQFEGAVWVTHFDSMTVPFYQASDAQQPGRSLCADLLMGIGEIMGCGERHATHTEALAQMKTLQVDPTEFAWYMEMKSISPVQTSGFGLGLERFLLWALCHEDIRDIPLFNRLKGVPCTP